MRANCLTASVMAVSAALIASATVAKTYTYTFGTQSGGAYCDGITFTNGGSGDGWGGNLLGSCGDENSVAGFTIKGETTNTIELSTGDTSFPGAFDTFLIQPKERLWYLYVDIGSGFLLVNEGKLIKGPPPISRHGAKSAIFKNPKAVDKPVL